MNLLKGDCLNLLKDIPDKSIDMILTDPPYGCTECEWDKKPDTEKLFTELKRIAKDKSAVVVFANMRYAVELIQSNLKFYRYDIVWEKSNKTGFLDANRRPLRIHEFILIFGHKLPDYYPQKTAGKAYYRAHRGATNVYSHDTVRTETVNNGDRFPVDIVKFQNANRLNHNTQKPVELLEYLIKTYSKEGDTVLDCFMGSGSTGVACVNTKREFIGMELNDKFFDVATDRINKQCDIVSSRLL